MVKFPTAKLATTEEILDLPVQVIRDDYTVIIRHFRSDWNGFTGGFQLKRKKPLYACALLDDSDEHIFAYATYGCAKVGTKIRAIKQVIPGLDIRPCSHFAGTQFIYPHDGNLHMKPGIV